MTYTLAQKNRWNRFRRNMPRLARGFKRSSDQPETLCEMWINMTQLGRRARKNQIFRTQQ